MNIEASLGWAEGRGGRWELRDGQPVMTAPGRPADALTKLAGQIVLKDGSGGRPRVPHLSRRNDGQNYRTNRLRNPTRWLSGRPPPISPR